MEHLLFLLTILFLCLFVSSKVKLHNARKELEQTKVAIKDVADIDAYRKKTDEYCAQAEESANKFKEERYAEADNYRKKIEDQCKERESAADQRCQSAQATVNQLTEERKRLEKDLKALELDYTIGVVKVDEYEHLKSDEVKNRLTMLRAQQDEFVRTGNALIIINATALESDLKSQKKQILRCFNAECKSIIEATTVKNVDSTRAKIQRSYETINKIFAVDGVQISSGYLALKYDELSMVYAYMLKEDEEREQRRAIREQMVEEEKVRREIEQAKKRIEKEELQFSREIDKLTAYMQKAPNDVERQLYINKISELEAKLKAVEADKENVLQREQNTRAGFVYIISNIGSFGEHIYKIGMTRRLEPMERIAELSSASVPFPFDVHAMIFSDDAPGLEAILHRYFNEMRVNKVNFRKEFFKVDLEEIKKVVLKNHNATVKFVDFPEASEYRTTLMQEATSE